MLPKYLVMICFTEVQFHIYNSSVKCNGNTAVRVTWHYIAAELPVFHSKIENQAIIGKTHLCVNSCEIVLAGIFPKWLLKYLFSLFCYVLLLDVIIAAKFFVIIFSAFSHQTTVDFFACSPHHKWKGTRLLSRNVNIRDALGVLVRLRNVEN